MDNIWLVKWQQQEVWGILISSPIKEEYWDQPAHQKDINFSFTIGKWTHIPIPVGLVYSTANKKLSRTLCLVIRKLEIRSLLGSMITEGVPLHFKYHISLNVSSKTYVLTMHSCKCTSNGCHKLNMQLCIRYQMSKENIDWWTETTLI